MKAIKYLPHFVSKASQQIPTMQFERIIRSHFQCTCLVSKFELFPEWILLFVSYSCHLELMVRVVFCVMVCQRYPIKKKKTQNDKHNYTRHFFREVLMLEKIILLPKMAISGENSLREKIFTRRLIIRGSKIFFHLIIKFHLSCLQIELELEFAKKKPQKACLRIRLQITGTFHWLKITY